MFSRSMKGIYCFRVEMVVAGVWRGVKRAGGMWSDARDGGMAGTGL